MPAEATAEANLIPPISEQGLDFVTLRKQRTLTMSEDIGKNIPKMEEELHCTALPAYEHVPPTDRPTVPTDSLDECSRHTWTRQYRRLLLAMQ